MAVKYLKRAADGAAVQNYDDILAQQLASQQAQQELQNQVALVELLSGLNAQMTPQAAPQVNPFDVAQENRLAAQAAADSYHPSAQYLLGLNPGGLYDAMAAFMGKFGPTPSLESGQRLINRVPMGGMGDAMSQAQAMSSMLGASQPAEPEGPYTQIIRDLVSTIIEQSMAEEQATSQAAASVGTQGQVPPTGRDMFVSQAPASPGAPVYDVSGQGAAPQVPELGGGLQQLVQAILSGAVGGAGRTGEAVDPRNWMGAFQQLGRAF